MSTHIYYTYKHWHIILSEMFYSTAMMLQYFMLWNLNMSNIHFRLSPLNRSNLTASFEILGQKVLLPKRVGGTRWQPHTRLALKHLIKHWTWGHYPASWTGTKAQQNGWSNKSISKLQFQVTHVVWILRLIWQFYFNCFDCIYFGCRTYLQKRVCCKGKHFLKLLKVRRVCCGSTSWLILFPA